MNTQTKNISLEELMIENHEKISRQTRIDIQILRVIANSNTGTNLGPARVYGAYRSNRNQSSNINYSRLFLCRIVSEIEGDTIVYLMESRNCNNNMWKRNPQLRDDGVISIGSIIRLLSPSPIKSMMANEIPMLETRFPVIVMRFPQEIHPITVNLGISGNQSKGFALNKCKLSIMSSIPEETRCSGLFCDKQRIHEIMDKAQGCGCYSMLCRRSNLVIDHSLQIECKAIGWSCFVEKFSSNRFSMLYQSAPFPSSLRASALQLTDHYWDLTDTIERVVKFINDNGGFTVIGWYKRGLINDQSLTSDNSNSIKEN